MSGFDDFGGQLDTEVVKQTFPAHVIGTRLVLDLTLVDGDMADLDLSTGFTAICTPQVDGRPLAVWTETLTQGRRIDLSVPGYLVMRATPAASQAAFGGNAGRTAVLTLLVTRTSDGVVLPIFDGCFLPLHAKRN